MTELEKYIEAKRFIKNFEEDIRLAAIAEGIKNNDFLTPIDPLNGRLIIYLTAAKARINRTIVEKEMDKLGFKAEFETKREFVLGMVKPPLPPFQYNQFEMNDHCYIANLDQAIAAIPSLAKGDVKEAVRIRKVLGLSEPRIILR